VYGTDQNSALAGRYSIDRRTGEGGLGRGEAPADSELNGRPGCGGRPATNAESSGFVPPNAYG